jgi:hypothetical protein
MKQGKRTRRENIQIWSYENNEGTVEDKPRVKKVLMASPACFYQAVHSPQLNSQKSEHSGSERIPHLGLFNNSLIENPCWRYSNTVICLFSPTAQCHHPTDCYWDWKTGHRKNEGGHNLVSFYSQNIRLTPLSWITVISCHYTRLISPALAAGVGKYKIVCWRLRANHYTKFTSWVCVALLQVMGRPRYDIS